MTRKNITPAMFVSFPVGRFQIEQRRSLTVHIKDPGMWDVFAVHPQEHSAPAGRYETFAEAAAVADGLNRVWHAAPACTAREVLAFVRRDKPRVMIYIERGLIPSVLSDVSIDATIVNLDSDGAPEGDIVQIPFDEETTLSATVSIAKVDVVPVLIDEIQAAIA